MRIFFAAIEHATLAVPPPTSKRTCIYANAGSQQGHARGGEYGRKGRVRVCVGTRQRQPFFRYFESPSKSHVILTSCRSQNPLRVAPHAWRSSPGWCCYVCVCLYPETHHQPTEGRATQAIYTQGRPGRIAREMVHGRRCWPS